jgi:hypothetical protein
MSTCHSCQAEVIFVPSAKTGKPMILNAKPERRIALVHGQGFALIPSLARDPIRREDRQAVVAEVYIDHHATCSAAAAWKGRTRAGRS